MYAYDLNNRYVRISSGNRSSLIEGHFSEFSSFDPVMIQRSHFKTFILKCGFIFRNTLTRNKETRGSKISLFRRSTREKREAKRRESDLGMAGSLGRRKRRSMRNRSEGKDCEVNYGDEEHTDVHNKGADMFS